ncbi:MAG: hypothetical protein HYX59_13980 [Elusimicrobia bacterium]|nr:hypothetical protein [Elusimicrobiota bacterium]
MGTIIFLVVAVGTSALCWYAGRRRVQWRGFEYLVPVIPYVTWAISASLVRPLEAKSLSNLIELPILSLIVAVLVVGRVALGGRITQRTAALVHLTAAVLSGPICWIFFPGLKE